MPCVVAVLRSLSVSARVYADFIEQQESLGANPQLSLLKSFAKSLQSVALEIFFLPAVQPMTQERLGNLI